MSVSRDRSVGTATSYGLWGLEIESRWGGRFSAAVQTGPGAHPASYIRSTGSSPGVKRPRRGVDHSPHLSPRLKKECSYTSAPSLGLRGLFYGELYLHLYLYILFRRLYVLSASQCSYIRLHSAVLLSLPTNRHTNCAQCTRGSMARCSATTWCSLVWNITSQIEFIIPTPVFIARTSLLVTLFGVIAFMYGT